MLDILGRSESPARLTMAIKERKYRDAVLDGLYTFTATQGWSNNHLPRKLETLVDVLADWPFFPNRIETLHRRRYAMIPSQTPPRPLIVERVLVVLVDMDFSLFMDRHKERSPRCATFRRSRSRDPRESRHRDNVMGRCPLCR